MYLSAKFAHHGWHVGLTKAGKPKRGKRTAYGQKAIQFIRKPIVPVTPNNTPAPSNGKFFDHQDQMGKTIYQLTRWQSSKSQLILCVF